jgi:hypothetical protein
MFEKDRDQNNCPEGYEGATPEAGPRRSKARHPVSTFATTRTSILKRSI